MDGVFAIALLILLSWLIVLIIVAYAVTANLPAFFIHRRIGRKGAGFNMIKFRTLSDNHELPVQQRRFTLGDFLRATNLDELPQIINVLKGEMSLVGPRPLPIEYQQKFSAEQNTRHQLRPGITGLAQISGKNSIPWSQKLELDVKYVRELSFKNDCLILLKTVTLVLSMKRDVSLNEEKL